MQTIKQKDQGQANKGFSKKVKQGMQDRMNLSILQKKTFFFQK